MENESNCREGLFWSKLSKMNVGYMFMVIKITPDFAREIEANITDTIKQEIQFMIMNETYITPGYSHIYYQNCITWLKSTKLITDELIDNKKLSIIYLENLVLNHMQEDMMNQRIMQLETNII